MDFCYILKWFLLVFLHLCTLKGSTIYQTILAKLNSIMLTQKTHTEILTQLAAQSGVSVVSSIPKPSGWPSIPLPSVEEFFKWDEQFLSKASNYAFAVSLARIWNWNIFIKVPMMYTIFLSFFQVQYFSQSSGLKSYKENTREVLRQMISPELKLKLNWNGSDLKYGLKSRKTGKLIIGVLSLPFLNICIIITSITLCHLNNVPGAVQVRHADVAPKQITKEISTWLRNNLPRKNTDTDQANNSDDVSSN